MERFAPVLLARFGTPRPQFLALEIEAASGACPVIRQRWKVDVVQTLEERFLGRFREYAGSSN